MISHLKSIKQFGLKLKTEEILNRMLYEFLVWDIYKKMRTYSDKAFTNFGDLNLPKHEVECGTFTTISIDCLLVYDKN